VLAIEPCEFLLQFAHAGETVRREFASFDSGGEVQRARVVMPWIELMAGLALVLGIRARAGAAITLALMIFFTIAVAAAWARGLDFRCGCFGKIGAATIGAQKFAENVGLTLIAALAARRERA